MANPRLSTDLLYGGSFSETDWDSEDVLSALLHDYSPIIGTNGQFLPAPTIDTSCVYASTCGSTNQADLVSAASLVASSTPATTVEEIASNELAVKELVVKVLPPTLAEKDSRSYTLKNIPKAVLASMECFRTYPGDQLDLSGGVGNVGHFLRGGKKVWLKCSQDLVSLATRPYFVTAHGGRKKVGSSRMCKFHTSQSTHYRAFIRNVDYEQRRRIILSSKRKRRPVA